MNEVHAGLSGTGTLHPLFCEGGVEHSGIHREEVPCRTQPTQSQDQGHEIAPWADDQTRQHLQVLVEGVATLAGFEQSAVTLRRDEICEIIAAAGVSDGFVGTLVPTEVIESEIATAEEWGVWRFVHHDRIDQRMLDYSHVPDLTPLDGDDAWHPLDSLFAPFYDDSGELLGLLGVDSPHDGRLPSQDTLDVLTRYAGVARSLVLVALERQHLTERVRIADEARQIVRRALGEPSLELVLEACRAAVTSCFDAAGMWLTAFHGDGVNTTTSYALGGGETPLFSEIDDVVIRLAHRYWDDQYVAHFSHAQSRQPGLPRADAERLLAFLDRIGIGSVLFVPLGAGPECLGFLVLTRVSDTPAGRRSSAKRRSTSVATWAARSPTPASSTASEPSPTGSASSTAIGWRWSTPSATSCARRCSR